MIERFFKCTVFVVVFSIFWINPISALKPRKEYPYTPDTTDTKYEEVHFKTKDGLSLIGWFLPAQDTVGNIVKGVKPIIIITLADEGNMAYMMWHYVNFFRSDSTG